MTEAAPVMIFEMISNNYYHLTNSEKKVADYVLSHKIEAQYMSISELAEECGVAEATISRFCRRLKLRGYNAFKLAIAKAVAGAGASDRSVVPSADVFVGEITENDDLTEMSKKLYAAHMSALGQTMSLIDASQLNEAVELMYQARRVFCMGQGGSMILAMEAANLFSTISSKFQAVQDSHTQASHAALMEEGDVVLFFSYSGSTKDIVDLIGLAQEHQAKIILITRFLKSPGARQSDVVLQCGSNEGPLQLGSVSAKMAQLFLLDVLYNELCRRDPELARKNQEKIAGALATKHL